MLLGKLEGTHVGTGVFTFQVFVQTDGVYEDTGTITYDDGIDTDDGRNVGQLDDGVYV
jgi:hypothetical protein